MMIDPSAPAAAAQTANSLKPDNWIAIGSALLTALVTAIGLYIGPKLAVRRSLEQFRSQKWWERQHEMYTNILEDLSAICAYTTNRMNAPAERITPELVERVTLARHRLELTALTGAYLVSETAAKALLRYQKEISDPELIDNTWDMWEITSNAAEQCLQIIRSEANAHSQMIRIFACSSSTTPRHKRR